MLDFTSTSRIRRKVKTKLTRFRDKFQEELTQSLNEITNSEGENISVCLKKIMRNEKLGSTLSLNNAQSNLTDDKDNENRILEHFSSSDSDSESESEKELAPYRRIQLDNPEDATVIEKLGLKLIEKGAQMHRYFKKSRVQDVNKRLKSEKWISVVNLALIEGKFVAPCNTETGRCDAYVKFRLGTEIYKSQVIGRSLNPRWLEQFDLHLYDDSDQELEITVWDKDNAREKSMGRCVITLSTLDWEKTHIISQELEEGSGSLHLLLTISGTTASGTVSDLTKYEDDPLKKLDIMERYSLHRTLKNVDDVGHLTVKVYKAVGLAAADLGGNSDPFCVLELENTRLQTQTEYKTLSPNWNKIFTFNVKDINNVLFITIFDEYRDHQMEFLGKVCIPLLRIYNGEKRWYALKDKRLRNRAKGAGPQIELELTIVWNPIRACIKTLNPKEEKYMQKEAKFKTHMFVNNVLRLKLIAMDFYEVANVFNMFNFTVPCLSWIAIILLITVTIVLYIVPIRYLLMLGLIAVFLKPEGLNNNQLVNVLSRIPDNEMLLDRKHLKLLMNNEPERRCEPNKKQKTS